LGIYIHSVCVFSIRNLPQLVTRPEYFLNKFRLEYDPIAYQCMEEWMNNKIKTQEPLRTMDYCRLPFLEGYTENKDCLDLMKNVD
jgi:hypothetical protein